MSVENPITLAQLNQRIQTLLYKPEVINQWVMAELSDVAERGGHCYLELLQKDDGGRIIAKSRAAIWANVWQRIVRPKFERATGQRFATGIKVMVCVSVSMHAVYGLSLVINDVDPSYTLGERERLRRESIARLTADGVINLNRELPLPVPAMRIGVITAPGAAGYGDFVNQLFSNRYRLRFDLHLYQAVMQGEKAPASIIAALERAVTDADDLDVIVIIRGGGASSDLDCFEDYNLAYNIANCPLPVIIGIGHERDVTLLDFVANMRLKTPTAAAEWLIAQGEAQLSLLDRLSRDITATVQARLNGCARQLTHCEGLISTIGARIIAPQYARLEMASTHLPQLTASIIARHNERLDNAATLAEALSPRATLRRGFTATRVAGRIIHSVADVKPGETIQTILADGVIMSTALTSQITPTKEK